MIGAFINNKLIMTDSNCNFQDMHQEVESIIMFNEEIKQTIVSNGAMKVKDASVKKWKYGRCVEILRFA